MQRVGDRSRAVVPLVLPAGVAASPDIRPAANVVGGGDHPLDRPRGRARGDGAFAVQRRERARGGRRRRFGGRRRFGRRFGGRARGRDAARRFHAGDFGFRLGGRDRGGFDRFARVGGGEAARFGARRRGERQQRQRQETDNGGETRRRLAGWRRSMRAAYEVHPGVIGAPRRVREILHVDAQMRIPSSISIRTAAVRRLTLLVSLLALFGAAGATAAQASPWTVTELPPGRPGNDLRHAAAKPTASASASARKAS